MRSVVDALKLFWSDINSLEELRQIRAARHDVICDIATVREEKEELLRRKKGGGGKGRRIIMRDFEKAYAVVMAN